MGQPIRKGLKESKKRIKKVNKSTPVNPKRVKDAIKVRKKTVVQQKKDKEHPEYGTSELEVRFAKNFLDKLGVKYIYQFKMASIGRYLDFYIVDCNIALEIDGDYWHGYGLLYEQMNPTQKRSHRVDKEKTRWCLINGIPLIRIWEHDINDHPEAVMKMLKEKFGIARENKEKQDKKKQRH